MNPPFKQAAIALTFFVLGAAGVAAIAANSGRSSPFHQTVAASSTTANQTSAPVSTPVQVVAPAEVNRNSPKPTATPASPTATATVTLTALPADATSVPDDALSQLSNLVDLKHAATQPPDKQRWAQAIPAASKLMEGPCDCDQRNWLKHFVKMGNAAFSDSHTDYSEEAQLLSTIRRNDTQVTPTMAKSN